MSAITTTPTTIQFRPSRLVGLLLAVAVVAAALTWGAVATFDSDTSGERTAVATPVASVYGDLSKIAALAADELGWAYRSTPRWAIGLTEQERAYVEGIMAMTPEERGAAFGRSPVGAPSTGEGS
jgi:hypothetical protein